MYVTETSWVDSHCHRQEMLLQPSPGQRQQYKQTRCVVALLSIFQTIFFGVRSVLFNFWPFLMVYAYSLIKTLLHLIFSVQANTFQMFMALDHHRGQRRHFGPVVLLSFQTLTSQLIFGCARNCGPKTSPVNQRAVI